MFIVIASVPLINNNRKLTTEMAFRLAKVLIPQSIFG
ncbi:Uncharacterized HTH-type transcriptional regulator ybaQ [Escherichia coli]|nr:Uncharacterized HTH-type transcriptional regulator ybaQ [Escherichia coli]